jgi:hypothetical protein
LGKTEKNTKLLQSRDNKEIGQAANAEKTKYMVMSRGQNEGQNNNMKRS